MSHDSVRIEREGPIAQLVLNRPDKLNAITHEMLESLNAAMDAVEADPGVRVIILRGEGRAFSAGFDLSELQPDTPVEQTRRMLQADFDLIMRFWNSPKPTLSAVHGYVLGGGFELAMACDATIAAEGTLFGEPEPKFGSGIVALLLPWLAGPKLAREMLLFGNDRITAERALALGIINRLVAPDALIAEAIALAGRCAMLDAHAVKLTKQAINNSYAAMGIERALREALDIDLTIETTDTEESRTFKEILAREGVKAAIAWRESRVFRPGADRR